VLRWMLGTMLLLRLLLLRLRLALLRLLVLRLLLLRLRLALLRLLMLRLLLLRLRLALLRLLVLRLLLLRLRLALLRLLMLRLLLLRLRLRPGARLRRVFCRRAHRNDAHGTGVFRWYHTRTRKCARPRGCSDRRFAVVRAGVQGGIAVCGLHVLLLGR
jgi:hypothetical protein